ncbi:MAG: DUF4160 domain-containing protein [Chitinophagales bacterium]|nr:DUF4160 domain-containing protein [Chitinophagales bacterium]
MPTVFNFLGFRFYFFSNDHEPIHIHISKGGAEAKYDILPKLRLIRNEGFKKGELKMIEAIIEENEEIIIERWELFFN